MRNRRTNTRAGICLAFAAALVTGGCPSSEVDSALSSFAFSFTPNSITVRQGDLATVAIAGTWTGGVPDPAVSFSTVSGVTGITVTYSNVVQGASGSGGRLAVTATMSIIVDDNKTPGVYKLTVKGASGDVSDFVKISVTVTAKPTFTLALTPAAVSLVQGASATSVASIAPANGFNAATALTLSAVPLGLTVTPVPASITPPATASLAITASGAMPPGTYSVTVTGTSGTLIAAATLTITVTTAPGFTLSYGGALPISVTAGGFIDIPFTISRIGGFSGTIDFGATGATTGMTPVFTPSSTTGNNTTMRVNTTSAAAIGSGTLNVTATSGALSAPVVPITFNVTQPTIPVTFDFGNCGVTPVVAGFQDGAGAWTSLTASGNQYHTFMTSSTGAVAYITSFAPGIYTTTVTYYAQGEIANTTTQLCFPFVAQTNNSMTATVSGMGLNDQGLLVFGGSTQATTFGVTNLNFPRLPIGQQDLFGYKFQSGSLGTANRGYRQTGISVVPGGSLGVINVAGGPFSFVPMGATFNLPGFVAGETVLASVGYFSASCIGGDIYALNVPASSTLYGFPAGVQGPGEMHRVTFDLTTPTTERTIVQYFNAWGFRNMDVSEPLTIQSVAAPGGNPFKMVNALFAPVPGIPGGEGTLKYFTAGGALTMVVNQTNANRGAAANFDIRTPNISSLQGFLPSMVPQNGTPTAFVVQVAPQVPVTGCGEGTTSKSSAAKGTI